MNIKLIIDKVRSLSAVVMAAVSVAVYGSGIADMKFSRMNSRDGLSCGAVNCVYKDSTGYMWIGTGFGLNRYDGTRVKCFYHDPNDSTSLAFNAVDRIQCDYRGWLWLNLYTSYCTLNPVTGKFDQHPEQFFSKDLKVDAWIYKIFIASDKSFWFCAMDKGIYRYDPLRGRLKKFGIGVGPNEVPKGQVSHITQYHKSIVMTYKNGVMVAFDSQGRRVQWKSNTVQHILGTADNDFRVDIDRAGIYWIRTNYGMIIHVTKSGKNYLKLNEFFKGEGFDCDYDYQVRDVEMDAAGNHWLATDHGGLIIFNMNSKKCRQFMSVKNDAATISDNTLQYIYRDDINRMWISTYGNGLNQWSEYNEGFSNIPLGDICTCVEENSRVLWAGSNNEGLIRYDIASGEKKIFNKDNSPLLTNTVVSSCRTSDGTLWFGTFGSGLIRYKDGDFKVYTTKNSGLAVEHVWSLVEDKQGYLWIGTLGMGVQRMNPKNDKFITIGRNSKLGGMYVSSISLDINGNILASTSNGYSLIDSKTFEVTNVERPADGESVFSAQDTNQALCDSRGLIWICTTAGLNVYDPLTGKNYILNNTNGLFGTVAYGVAEDAEGDMWVITEFSISKVTVKIDSEQCRFFVMNYDERDGLQQGPYNQRSICFSSTGKIYVGGRDGIDVITPSKNMFRTVNPRVIFSDLQLYGEDVVIGKKYDDQVVLRQELNTCREVFLKEGSASISIYLGSSDCAIRSRTRFIYWVEGLNDAWISTDESLPVINLMGLTGGTYRVHVRALDDRGNECKDEGILIVHVNVPIWRSWWAICLYVIAVLALFVLCYRNQDELVRIWKKVLGVDRRKQRAEQAAMEKKRQLTPDQRLERNVRQYIEQNIGDPDISVVTMAHALNIPHMNMYTEITRILKTTPSELIRTIRIETACKMLENTDKSIVDIAFATGFRHVHAFTESFTELKRVSPKMYREIKCGENGANVAEGGAKNVGQADTYDAAQQADKGLNDYYSGDM